MGHGAARCKNPTAEPDAVAGGHFGGTAAGGNFGEAATGGDFGGGDFGVAGVAVEASGGW